MKKIKTNSIIKLTIVSLLSLFGLWLVYSLFTGAGLGFNLQGYYGGGHMNMIMGFGFGSTLAYALLFLIKVLFAVFTISLLVGIMVWIKNNIFTEQDVEKIKSAFKCSSTTLCTGCNKPLEFGWKLCPHCGSETEAPKSNDKAV